MISRRLSRSVQLYDESGELIVFWPGEEPGPEFDDRIGKHCYEAIDDAPPLPEEGDYENYTVPQLLEQARERQVDLSGASKKADIIHRLAAADASDQ